MTLILGIESTCDETGVAVVRDGREVLANVVASSAARHAAFGGVVPEIAGRAQLEDFLPTLRVALETADVPREQLAAVAVASRPGLIGSLLVGLTAVKTLAWSWRLPLIDVDHVHAHLYSVLLDSPANGPADVPFPAVGLVVSGGHTSLYLVRDWLTIERLGGTIDDAVGEAYDKVATLLGLGYPGGPILDRLACDSADATAAHTRGYGERHVPAVRFPRPLLGRASLDFSFSGLKTAVLYHVRGHAGREREASTLTPYDRATVAAAFQDACVDVLITKIKRALKATGARSVMIGGGVSANAGLRAAVSTRLDVPTFLPSMPYTTDNAAMTAGLAYERLRAGLFAPLTLDATPTGRV